MTRSERRKARRAAFDEGRPLTGELALDRGDGPIDFTEAGYDARECWAHHYDDLNGAPESDADR